jgi:iron(III) transport system permease protein
VLSARGRLGLTAVALGVAAAALLPLGYLLVRAAEADGGAWDVVLDGRTVELVLRTALLVGLVTVLAVVIGVALAWLVERTDLPGRRVVAVAAALPLVIPSYVAALALLAAVGPGGLLAGGTWIFGLPGSTVALTLATYPYVFLLVAASLRRMDPALEEASRLLGRSRAATFRAVTLPVLRPSIAGGGVLVALYALSDFGVVSLMRYEALTRAVFEQYRSSFDRTPAALLGLVLVVLTAVILLLEARTAGAGRTRRSAAGADRPAERAPLGRWKVPALLFVVLVVGLGLVVPVAVLVGWSLRDTADLPGAGDVAGWAWHSVLGSGLAAVAAMACALPVAALAARHARPWTRRLQRATYASNALPGIVIALSLVFFSTRVAPGIYQTLLLLVAAYVVRFLPQALAGAHSALARVDPALEQAARGLGASPFRALRTVTAPLLAPGLLAGATLVFLSTMKELPVTLLLRPIGFDTLATEVWSATGVTAYGEAAVPALALVVLSAPVVYALQVRPRAASAPQAPPREG